MTTSDRPVGESVPVTERGPRAPTPYYQDDFATIYHGDCLTMLAWLSADVLVTDPPYGIRHSSSSPGAHPWRGVRSIAGDDDATQRDGALALWGDRPALVFGTWRVPIPERTRAVVVWDKGDVGMGDLSMPWKPSHEQVYVLGDGFHGHRGPGVVRHNMCTHYTKGRLHPHQKPLELMSGLLAKCPPGVIADPFMGSGATLRAAKDSGRRCIGVEIDERYCEIAAKRLAQEVLDFGGVA